MLVALQIIQIIFQSVAILFMICFMFIGIWSFIIFLKMSKTQRLQTYLLEKINKSISTLKVNNDNNIEKNEAIIEDLFESDKNVIRIDDNIK